MNKTLLVIGGICLLAGLLWPWLRQMPLGRLPGDILIVRENTRIFFPITSCIVVSLVLSILLWIFRK